MIKIATIAMSGSNSMIAVAATQMSKARLARPPRACLAADESRVLGPAKGGADMTGNG
nr:hypothetical protein [Chelatococcus reniformis]